MVTSALELTADTSHAYRNRPEEPTHWTDHAHRNALVRTWDMVQDTVSHSRYGRSTTAQLVSAEKQMLERFSELGEGRCFVDERLDGVCAGDVYASSVLHI